MTFRCGDIVTPNRPIDGLTIGQSYKIERINYGIDGAYDFDEVYLEGVSKWVCEFYLENHKK